MNKNILDLYQDGKIDQAIHLLIKEIDQHPKDPDNYLTLSTYLIEQGESAQAVELLEKARGVVDDPKVLDYNLAASYYANGDFEKAIALLDKIPNDDLTLYQKALVYLKIGQGQKALAYALTIKNNDDRVKELIGDIWLSLGNLDQAYDAFSSIAVENRSAKVNFLLGISIFEKDPQAANDFFEKSKKLDKKYFSAARRQYDSIMNLIKKKEKGDD